MSVKARSHQSFALTEPTPPTHETTTDDEIQEWNPYLYSLQRQAPRPFPVACHRPTPDRPSYYGSEYHGAITRDEAAKLLQMTNGAYLVRSSMTSPGEFSLSLIFESRVRHFKLYYDSDEGQHYVGDKRFDTMYDLVQDGLITYHIEAHAKDYVDRLPSEGRKYATLTKKKKSYVNIAIEYADENAEYHAAGDIFRRSVRSHAGAGADQVKGVKSESSITQKLGLSPRVRARMPTDNPSSYQKAHVFKVTTFHGAHWCDFCRNFMWGLRAQGVRCHDCGYQCHKTCSGFTDKDCQPDAKRVKRVFGIDLTTVTKVHGTRHPIVLELCVAEIELRGMEEEGLYRVPGFADDIVAIKRAFDKDGKGVDLGRKLWADINIIAGVLKQYLRELPIPLVTFDVYSDVLEALKNDTETMKLFALRTALQNLPKPHFNSLFFLMSHLTRVTERSDKNMMDADNLGIVFGPTVMRSEKANNLEALTEVPLQKKAVSLMIQYKAFLFEP
ncbi:beta-chimaerin-like [Oscarella lobularis]|uniref:beta-chimaerin-like n=1 Tax=Oscarella lobularis TaxID=121494 RepID=UPI003313F78D